MTVLNYCGHTGIGLVAFKSEQAPTEQSHGSLFKSVVGPFDTERAAIWASEYGYLNPHFRHVSDAERLSANYKVGLCKVLVRN